jgi:hypothetical protein
MSRAALAVVLLLALPTQAAAAWRPPVRGPVTRAFDVGTNPYAGGHHRGIDLAARPGTTVRAPCTGRVAVAGRVGTSGGVVTLLCGHWRVTHMPLATITVRTGTTITAGTNLGRLAPGHDHAGLHLGVRRAGTRFGYVDPLDFFDARPSAPPTLGPAPHSRRPHHLAPHQAAPPQWTAPVSAPAGFPISAPVGSPISAPARPPASMPSVAPMSAPAEPPLAPWPAWAGLALVLAGAGAGVRWRGGPRTRTRWRVRAGVRLNL